MAAFIDREKQIDELRALFDTPGMKMAILYGRRRVGKSSLLTHVWPEASTFYFVASETTPAINRRELITEGARWAGQEAHPADFPTWRTTFRFLLEMKPTESIAIVLDEYQYLRGEKEEDVDSQLLAAWETTRIQAPRDRSLVLALCGSIVGTMERLDGAGRPLHGRAHWKEKLEPFDYYDAGKMVPFKKLPDRAIAYGVVGGTPRYLETLEPNRPLGDSVASAVLSPRGEVRSLVETVIEQEQAIQSISQYKAILAAIASGSTERNAIAQITGLNNDYGLRSMLGQLESLGYIVAHRNFGSAPNEAYRYWILDPALLFYYRIVLPFRNELETSAPKEVWRSHIKRLIDSYMGRPVFEMMAKQGYNRLRARRGLPLVREWSRWEGTDRAHRSIEMDIVSRLTDGRMLTGQVKWNRRPLSIDIHKRHLRDLDRLADSGKRWAHQARQPQAPLLFVASGGFQEGFEARALESGHPVTLITLDDMYEESYQVR